MRKAITLGLFITIFHMLSLMASPKYELFKAVNAGDVEQVKLALETDTNFNNRYNIALINAVNFGFLDIVKVLLENGADPNAENSEALINAVNYGHLDIVKILLENGADPNAAFINAVKYGRLDIVKVLLEKEINADIKKITLLDAAYFGHFEIAKLLLENGADPNVQDSQPLINAAHYGHYEIVKLLLENGANPNERDAIALNNAAYYGHFEIVKLLLEKGADPNSQRLIDNAYHGHLEIAKLFLEKGADPTIQDSQALINAADNGYLNIVELLLDNGADLWAQNSRALGAFIQFQKPEIVELIQKKMFEIIQEKYELQTGNGADICPSDEASKMDIIRSIKAKHFDYFKLICEIDITFLSDREIIKEVLLSGNYTFVKYLFENAPEIKDAYLIGVGLNWTRSVTTDEILAIVSDKIKLHDNAYHIEISLEIAQDEDIMQHISGFINPGAGDSYPEHEEPFVLTDMTEENKVYHEKVYQQVITMAKKFDIPYLGLCAGAQHLVLNSNGALKRGGQTDQNTKIIFNKGTIPHFLLLTEKEKEEALSFCNLENIEFSGAYAWHYYAGMKDNLGEDVKLAAVTDTDIPEAFSLGANKIGSQFHPEMHYYDEDKDHQGINRHKQFLDNIFGIFEGYYKSMQYAKKMGIDQEVAKAAIQKVNQELIEYLEGCVSKVEYEKNIHLWDKGQTIELGNDVNSVSLMPGLTSENIAVTRESNDLVIQAKDGQGRLIFKDRFDHFYPVHLKFADGSITDLDFKKLYEEGSLAGNIWQAIENISSLN